LEEHRALVVGTRNYVRKNGFETVVVGLKGSAPLGATGGCRSSIGSRVRDAIKSHSWRWQSCTGRDQSYRNQLKALALARALSSDI
jgi:NH3-dependent NAD+ synthetase